MSRAAASVDSTELLQFLIEQELQDHCYVSHIADKYKGSDRPQKGLVKWLQRLSFLEEFQDSDGMQCVRIRTEATRQEPVEVAECAADRKPEDKPSDPEVESRRMAESSSARGGGAEWAPPPCLEAAALVRARVSKICFSFRDTRRHADLATRERWR